MSTTKTFSARVMISVYTGCGIPGVTFSDIHEVIEHLRGEPTWTHQLGQSHVWAEAQAEVLRQFPSFASISADELRERVKDKDGDERETAAEAWTHEQISALGQTEFIVESRAGRSYSDAAQDAMRSLLSMAGDKPVLVVSPPSNPVPDT